MRRGVLSARATSPAESTRSGFRRRSLGSDHQRSVGEFLEHNFILLVVLCFALPRIFWLFGSRKSPEQSRYFEVTGGQRATMAVLYFGLAGLLAAGMFAAKVGVEALDLR